MKLLVKKKSFNKDECEITLTIYPAEDNYEDLIDLINNNEMFTMDLKLSKKNYDMVSREQMKLWFVLLTKILENSSKEKVSKSKFNAFHEAMKKSIIGAESFEVGTDSIPLPRSLTSLSHDEAELVLGKLISRYEHIL